MTTLVLATRNAHKTAEIQAILGDAFQYLTLNDFPGAPAIAEDAETFAGNAAKKAAGVAEWLVGDPRFAARKPQARWFVLADDSGLEVVALHGAPGVHSARFAALAHSGDRGAGSAVSGNSPDSANNEKLLRLLQELRSEKRTARFRCVLALVEVRPRGETLAPRFFEGACAGHIAFAPRGQAGFGYDPLFVPVGFQQTFAELGEAVKNRLSHRAQALRELRAWWDGQAANSVRRSRCWR